MNKVAFREAAIVEVLPYYDKLHFCAILLMKLNKKTNQLFKKSKEFI
jgi:hypothetical protein